MKHGLFKRYFLGAAFIVTVSLGMMLLLLFVTYNNNLSREKHSQLKNACDSVSDFFSDSRKEDTVDSLRAAHFIAANISGLMNCDIFIMDETGSVIICSCYEFGTAETCEHIGAQIYVRELKRIISGEERFGTVGIYSSPRYIAATTVEFENGTQGYVFASASSESVKVLMTDSLKIYLLSSIVPLIVMLAALYLMSYRINKPLRLMSDAAKAMSKGDFSKRIPVTSDDEIGELAASFNQMTNSLSRLEETRKSFIANVSHEMRTPMTTIGGFIDGIIDGTIEPEKQNYYLGIASEEVKRLSRMIQSMLNLTRLESSEFVLKKDNFDFREQILSIVISQEQRIEEKSINIKGLDSLPAVTVNADKDLIHQAVYNLVDNAIKFVNESGEISFTLGVDSSGVNFSITNSGVGIPRGDLPFVFDRFYKLDKSRAVNKNSMGLGLYIVKTIIKNHGGTISVASKENEFTRFSFVMPLGK